MWPHLMLVWSVLLALGAAMPADAQPAEERRVSFAAIGGLSAASGTGGATVGATLALDVTPRVGVEARGLWLDRGVGTSAGELTANVLVDLLTARPAVPYLVAGGGVYHARFDLDRRQLFGDMAGQFAPGSRMVPINGTSNFGMMGANESYGGHMWNGSCEGATYTAPQMPAFYANRMGQMVVPSNGMWGMRGFTDPAVSLGGGVRMNLTERIWLRPEARALFVLADGSSYTVGTFSFGLGLKFWGGRRHACVWAPRTAESDPAPCAGGGALGADVDRLPPRGTGDDAGAHDARGTSREQRGTEPGADRDGSCLSSGGKVQRVISRRPDVTYAAFFTCPIS